MRRTVVNRVVASKQRWVWRHGGQAVQRQLAVRLAREAGFGRAGDHLMMGTDVGRGKVREGVGAGAQAYIPRLCGSHSASATFRSAAS